MSLCFPYTYISCPCSDPSRQALLPKRHSRDLTQQAEDEEAEEEKTFDPRHPRSNFSLFPPEHLLYCQDCHDIKCPRCITEEIVCWYCPSCLFETPSSMVRSEGNRCARNCFNCPICTSQLTVNTLGENGAREGPWILNCNYCTWTSLEIGIRFDKPTNIRSQLDRIANGGAPKAPPKPADSTDPSRQSSLVREVENFSFSNVKPSTASTGTPGFPSDPALQAPLDPASRFAALKAFFKDQIAQSEEGSGLRSSSADFAYSSPSSLARLMNLYTGLGASSSSSSAFKKPNKKAQPMREALYPSEGLLLPSPNQARETITKLQKEGSFNRTTTREQRLFQQGANGSGNPNARLVAELRPMPALLRTKRAKRCKECKHILVKPEVKPSSTRYRIKLFALSYIPLVTLKPVPGSPAAAAAAVAAGSRPSGRLGGLGDVVLQPGKPSQWILTMKNPLFDPVRMSLGTPAVTPGRFGHRVTVLCPQFEIGAKSDVWDNVLDPDAGKARGGAAAAAGEQVAEAGKVYEKGRNWVSVVIEIVPVSVKGGGLGFGTKQEEEEVQDEDYDVLEIPVRVRIEWKQSDVDDGGNSGKKEVKAEEKEEDEARRELSYWMVLGMGRVGA